MPASKPKNAGPNRSDGVATRERLVIAGEQLFASEGINAPLTSVLHAAGQRNKAALQYYFGSRRGLLDAILERHVEVIERERAVILEQAAQAGELANLSALVAALLVPAANRLRTPSGRNYLLILPQLLPKLDTSWKAGTMPPSLHRTIDAIEARLDASPVDAHARTTLVQVMQAAVLAERARQINTGQRRISHEHFVDLCTEMLTDALGLTRSSAPTSAEVHSTPRRTLT
jgi:AcrR family transcriptional regulator